MLRAGGLDIIKLTKTPLQGRRQDVAVGPKITFGAKAFNDSELCNECLADGNTTAISTGDTNRNVTVKFLKKHMACVNFTSPFSSLCSTVAPKICNFLKTKHTTHIAYVAAVRTRAVKISNTRAKHVK